jgi:hypothetical protein
MKSGLSRTFVVCGAQWPGQADNQPIRAKLEGSNLEARKCVQRASFPTPQYGHGLCFYWVCDVRCSLFELEQARAKARARALFFLDSQISQ